MIKSNLVQGSIMERLSTGNIWIDTAIAAIIPIAMRFLLPAGAYKPISGHLALDVIFLASIPVLRAKGDDIQTRLRAGGVSLFYSLRNTYETTIRFQKDVSTGLAAGGAFVLR